MALINYKQKGGDLPTRQDSLNLLNSSKAVLDHYKKQNYLTEVYPVYDRNVHRDNDLTYTDFLKRLSAGAWPQTQRGYGFQSEGPSILVGEYRKNIDKNKYKQRDNANAIIDLNSPMPLYDRRIKPSLGISASKTTGDMAGDQLSIYTYDPLQVTPWNMLNKQQQLERQKKYGANKGETNLLQTPQKKIKRILNTVKQPITPQPLTPEIPQPQPKKPITYKNETIVQYVREQNPERTDVNRQYNQAGNSHLVKKEFIRRVPVKNEETQVK